MYDAGKCIITDNHFSISSFRSSAVSLTDRFFRARGFHESRASFFSIIPNEARFLLLVPMTFNLSLGSFTSRSQCTLLSNSPGEPGAPAFSLPCRSQRLKRNGPGCESSRAKGTKDTWGIVGEMQNAAEFLPYFPRARGEIFRTVARCRQRQTMERATRATRSKYAA